MSQHTHERIAHSPSAANINLLVAASKRNFPCSLRKKRIKAIKTPSLHVAKCSSLVIQRDLADRGIN